jgi:hypothetical protein
MTTELTEEVTLAEAKQWLRERVHTGEHCPLCTQYAKVYRRTITAGMARALIAMWHHAGTEWFYLPDITSRWRSRDEAHLRHWGLIQPAKGNRPDGPTRGWWRVTQFGVDFIHVRVKVDMHALIYDDVLLGFDPENSISILDAIDKKFDYHALMRGDWA